MKTINRDTIFNFIDKQYESKPEYLWTKFPSYAVLRNRENNKWFVIIMNVPGEKLGLTNHKQTEILDVKCDFLMTDVLLNTKGFLPAYHMIKCNWITILLDGFVSKEEIFNLLNLSYALTKME